MIKMISQNLKTIQTELANLNTTAKLIAVSKTKPNEDIINAYEAGQRDFGENYIQELQTKSVNQEINTKCPDIRWHMIGPIQSNKANQLAKVKNLYAIHTVSTEKLVNKLQNSLPDESSVQIFIQINTSGEESKSGLKPDDLNGIEDLVDKIDKADKLSFTGLMTIGTPVQEDGSHVLDYKRLLKLRGDLNPGLKLSMGMSADYVQAIEHGSDYVRIGSKIFGARDYSKK